MAEPSPSPVELWQQAQGDHGEYLRLLREHGHLVPGKPEPLPCGWPRNLAATRAEPCIHDLDPVSCAVCNGAEKRAAVAERAERGPWFFSRHDGKCSGCGEETVSGEAIRADGEGGYLCEDCGGEP